jgi:4-amino-4-deoxy-L-arabinose transferase-like glycosyltransferase
VQRVNGEEAGALVARPPAWRRRLALAAIALSYLGLAVAYSLMTPAGEANDELDHVQYVEYIVQHGDLPMISVTNGDESHQPPLYYLLGAGWQEIWAVPPFSLRLRPGTPFAPKDMVHLAYRHTYSPAQREDVDRLHLLRVLSVLSGLGTVLLTYAAARLSVGDTQMSLAAAAFVAVLPKADVISGTVTNDALVVMLGAAGLVAFLAWLRASRRGAARTRRTWLAAGLGAVLGLAAITKFNSLPLAGLLLAVLAVVAVRRRDLLSVAAAVVAFAGVSGWWFVRNWRLYGSPLAQGAANAYLNRLLYHLVAPVPWSSYGRFVRFLPRHLLGTAWYDGGWNQFVLPGWMNDALAVVAVVAVVAGALWVLGPRARSSLPGGRWAGVALVAAALAGLVALVIVAKDTTQAEGRVTYVGLAAFATLCVTGTARLGAALPASAGGRLKWAPVLACWTFPALLAAVNGYVVVEVLYRFRGL